MERFHQLHDELKETQKENNKSDNHELNKINKELSLHYENTNSLASSINNIGEMITCIIETLKIQQALDSQDEEDKKSISLFGKQK